MTEKAGPKQVTGRVVETRWIGNGVFQLNIDLTPRPDFKPGQFVSINVPPTPLNEKELKRAYSVASPPERNPIELCVTKVEGGPGSTWLSTLKAGDEFKSWFPYGHFVYKPKPDWNVVFIATGTGIAPFRSMIFSKAFRDNPPKRAILLFGARHRDEVLYSHEFRDVPGLEYQICLSREADASPHFKGRVTDWLYKLDDSFPWKQTDFYLCGNGAMITEMETWLKTKRGVEKTSILKEAYFQPKTT
jgi:ferredoxin-NADP reductase